MVHDEQPPPRWLLSNDCKCSQQHHQRLQLVKRHISDAADGAIINSILHPSPPCSPPFSPENPPHSSTCLLCAPHISSFILFRADPAWNHSICVSLKLCSRTIDSSLPSLCFNTASLDGDLVIGADLVVVRRVVEGQRQNTLLLQVSGLQRSVLSAAALAVVIVSDHNPGHTVVLQRVDGFVLAVDGSDQHVVGDVVKVTAKLQPRPAALIRLLFGLTSTFRLLPSGGGAGRVLARVEVLGRKLVSVGGVQHELFPVGGREVIRLRVKVQCAGDRHGSDNLRR
ncbi:hypothetical protein F7725_013970, partial [Dissostichus mawsoni]